MDPRAKELIASLRLVGHPEGGHYAQTFRSTSMVTPIDGRGVRAGLTTIYFMLTEREVSRWHRVRSDEVWHFYEGAPLDLLHLSSDLAALTTHRLGPLAGRQSPAYTIPAGDWQAARSTGAYTLVGCTVGPGFEFDDFTLLADDAAAAARVGARWPEASALI
jgi:predicted cupin superfamily sugar epimerase